MQSLNEVHHPQPRILLAAFANCMSADLAFQLCAWVQLIQCSNPHCALFCIALHYLYAVCFMLTLMDLLLLALMAQSALPLDMQSAKASLKADLLHSLQLTMTASATASSPLPPP